MDLCHDSPSKCGIAVVQFTRTVFVVCMFIVRMKNI